MLAPPIAERTIAEHTIADPTIGSPCERSPVVESNIAEPALASGFGRSTTFADAYRLDPALIDARAATIVVEGGRLVSVRRRRFGRTRTVVGAMWDAGWGRPSHDRCYLHYRRPRSVPGYIVLDYIQSGRTAGYRTFREATRVLDAIAVLCRSQAVVAHVTNPLVTDRLMQRLGWQRHLEHWRGRHFIRRFIATS